MNRLLPILVLFSLIFAGPSSATVVWSGSFSGQADGFQRGDRIVPGHMNQIDAALDSIKTDLDGLTQGGGDTIIIDGTPPSGADTTFDLISGAGINITLDDTGNPDTGTFAIDLRASGGLELNGVGNAAELSLLSTCSDGEVLSSTSGTWACAAVAAGGTNVNVNGGSVSNPNFNSTTPAAGAGVINIPLAVSTSDVAVQLTLNNITDVGTLTDPVTILGALTLSETSASLQFTEANGSLLCATGDGAVGWNGTDLEKCESGTVVAIAGTDIVDPIQIDSNAVTDSAGVNFLGGDGVTVTHAGGVSPDTATVAVALGTNQGLEVNGGTLGLINDCANDEVLVWNGSAWVCGSRISGSSAVNVDGGATIATAALTDTSTVNVTDTAGTVTFDVIGTGITSLGTQTTKFTTDETGIEFQAQTGITTCAEATFGTNGGIFYDGDSDALKKCENGTLTDLAPDVNNITGPMGITGTPSNPTNLLDLIPSVDGGGTGNAGQPAFKIFGFDPVTGGAGASVNTTDPVFEVYHNGVVGITNNLSGGSRGGATNWTVLPSGVAQFQAIEDTDGPGTNFSITSAGAATFADALTVGNGMGVTDGAVTIAGTASTDDTDVQIGGDLANLTVDGVLTVKAGGNERILVLEAAAAAPPASTMMELQDGASTAVFRIRKDGYVTAQRIGDIDGPGNNWIIDEAGAANFTNTTVDDLTSAGTLAHSGGTATLSSGATDTVALGDGAGTLAGKVEVGGTQDQPQLVIEGHSTQTDSIVVVQDHLDEEIFNVNADGAVYAQSINDIDTGSSNWSIAADGTTDLGNTNVGGNLVTTGDTDTDTLGVGAVTTTSGKVEIGGTQDQPQLVVQGNSDQTNDVILVERNDGTDVFTLSNFGVLGVQSIQDIDGPGTNWNITGTGQATFSSTTVAGITSQGYITQTTGTALLAPGDGDELRVGGGIAGSGGKVEIGATTNQPQLMVKGHSTQTDSIVIVQDDADTEVFNIENDGTVFTQSIQDMERCQDEYSTPAAGGGEQTSGVPDGICDLDDVGRGIVGGTTEQPGRWGITENGRASFADIKFNSCEDIRSGTNVPQNGLYSDGLCDDDGRTPARGRLTFNDSGFKGTSQYAASDAEGAGQNTGDDDRDGFISTRCQSQAGQFLALETGCEMYMAVGRRDSIPHITLKDGVILPDNPDFESSITQIEIGAPLVPTAVVGSTAAIAMAGKTITGAIAIDYLSDGDYLAPGSMTNKWFFINGSGTGATLTITFGAPASTFVPAGFPGRADQDGRSACFYAATSDVIRIVSDDGTDGSDIMLNGTPYTVGTAGSPSITSSGSQGDFVCLLSANPGSVGTPEWYVLGQSGTWTGTQGAN